MGYQWIKEIQEQQQIGDAELCDGLCSEKHFQEIIDGRRGCRLELFLVILQRLGKEPDKLEYILSKKEYSNEYMRDRIQLCVFRKNRRWAENSFLFYERCADIKDRVHCMFVNRSRALIAYRLEEDSARAEVLMRQALDMTFDHWKESDWMSYRVSVFELENVLALVRLCKEQGKEYKALLARCGKYIEAGGMDGELYAKIHAKYTWLAAESALEDGRFLEALHFCMTGIRELGEYNIEYFMEPLLQTALRCYEKQPDMETEGLLTRKECFYALRALQNLKEKFGDAWQVEDCLFWNCHQKLYHLDYEMFRAERVAQNMTQEQAADGIYQNAKEIRKIEKGQSPHRKQFLRLTERYRMRGRKRCGFVISESYETLELWRKLQACSSRQQYGAMELLLQQLEQQLDMSITENRFMVTFYRNALDMLKGLRPYEEIMQDDWKLVGETYHISFEEIKQQPGRKPPYIQRAKRKLPRVYRPPLKIEADILNQIAMLLKRTGRKDEAIALYEGLVHTIECSRVAREYQLNMYGLLLGNLAQLTCSIPDAQKVIRAHLRSGKLTRLGHDYLTIACSMIDEPSNREVCRQMMKDCYYLLVLENSPKKRHILEDYYRKQFGQDIHED